MKLVQVALSELTPRESKWVKTLTQEGGDLVGAYRDELPTPLGKGRLQEPGLNVVINRGGIPHSEYLPGKARAIKKLKVSKDWGDWADGSVLESPGMGGTLWSAPLEGESLGGPEPVHCENCKARVPQAGAVYGARSRIYTPAYYCTRCSRELSIIPFERLFEDNSY